MRYACGVFSGKFLHQVCAEVMTLSGPQAKRSPADVRSFCQYAVSTLRAAKPRRLDCGSERKPVLIFTDGCWERGFAGIGAVLVDNSKRGKSCVQWRGSSATLGWLGTVCWGLHNLPDRTVCDGGHTMAIPTALP